ncbi:hypothetical protein [Flagellimonas beolgyonensis]|uniref:hypothetical protein n=1 Tax=Flagellimonas beolgyonensis TaxID=864064 RepID=UPI000F8C70BD|nr:hypothetical protein [Allomuricauda beolgyonensis]
MATDGTKIIDGDRAHDTYWGIMDLYDSEASLEMIIEEYPLKPIEYLDDFDLEVYVTSCGLAYWEIGLMTPDRFDYINEVIAKNACVDEWRKLSEKEGASRSRVLKSFVRKIGKNNPKVRTPKKYRKISNFIFGENEVLGFKLKDGSYRAAICMKIQQYRGNCNYWFVPITFQNSNKPHLESILREDVLGSRIGSGFDREETRKMQPGIEVVWNYIGGKPNFMFGFVVDAVEHKDLLKFKHRFERIGYINFLEGLKRPGSFGYALNFERLENRYQDLDNEIRIFNYEKYPISLLARN